jgi:hypothetical protein
MKRKTSRPVILTMPTFESCATAPPPPRIIPFPIREDASGSVQLDACPSEELREVRERLFRMIVATQLDRSHGNRAS